MPAGNQPSGHLAATADIIAGDGAHCIVAHVAVDQHDRPASAGALRGDGRGQGGSRDQHAVDLIGQKLGNERIEIPRMATGEQQRGKPVLLQLEAGGFKHAGIERVGQVGHHDAHHARPPGDQAARDGVGAVAQLLRGLPHLLARLVGDIGALGEGARHRGTRDARQAGHIDRPDAVAALGFHGTY